MYKHSVNKRDALPYLTCINENLWPKKYTLLSFEDWLKDIHTIIAERRYHLLSKQLGQQVTKLQDCHFIVSTVGF